MREENVADEPEVAPIMAGLARLVVRAPIFIVSEI